MWPRREALVFTAPDGRGGRALRMRSAREAQARTIAVINSFLREMSQGALRSFRYRATGGRELTAWLLYQPAIVREFDLPRLCQCVPGLVCSGGVPARERRGVGRGYDPRLFAARICGTVSDVP